ncbi:hypothetical protein AeNC1_016619, partial [Aphanomyces euteiches]
MSTDTHKTMKKEKKEKIKKEKKDKSEKDVIAEEEAGEEEPVKQEKIKKAKKEKKAKKRSRDEDEEDTDAPAASPTTTVESEEEPPAPKKSKVHNVSTIGDDNPPLSSFRISNETIANLEKRGINQLFPIQAMTFDKIYDKKDLIGRARTGMGKTLAFVLPVVELLLKEGIRRGRGRPPKVICMAPTRELAKQVAQEFELTGPSLTTTCIYGGASYQSQNNDFSKGVDIVVGTTGRICDHLDRGTLRLHQCSFFILDEADTMLEMGFREDIQKVFQAMQAAKTSEHSIQTLLFSATIPAWVESVAKEYMSASREYVNLVKDNEAQASTDVEHIAIPCHWQTRPQLLANLLSMYTTKSSRTIIFAETKKDCNELAVNPDIKQDAQVLHGDIAQGQRETTMQAFREGKLRLLIATDVAARGLDMDVDLVINSEPPRKQSGRADVETYVHRSGRTGRAGKKGICITLFTPKQKDNLILIERHIKKKFTMKSAPNVDDMITQSAATASAELETVHEDMLGLFLPTAEALIEKHGAATALASALACITGYTRPVAQASLLSGAPDMVTVMFESSNPIRAKGYVWNAVNRDIPGQYAAGIKNMQLTKDGMAACFELPVAGLSVIEELIKKPDSSYPCPYSIPKQLPSMAEVPVRANNGGGGYSNGYSGGRGG